MAKQPYPKERKRVPLSVTVAPTTKRKLFAQAEKASQSVGQWLDGVAEEYDEEYDESSEYTDAELLRIREEDEASRQADHDNKCQREYETD